MDPINAVIEKVTRGLHVVDFGEVGSADDDGIVAADLKLRHVRWHAHSDPHYILSADKKWVTVSVVNSYT